MHLHGGRNSCSMGSSCGPTHGCARPDISSKDLVQEGSPFTRAPRTGAIVKALAESRIGALPRVSGTFVPSFRQNPHAAIFTVSALGVAAFCVVLTGCVCCVMPTCGAMLGQTIARLTSKQVSLA
jgi:hypothetical protein